MGVTKKSIFSEEQNQIADIARVLGHPARIAILQYLIKMKVCIGKEIIKEIGLSQPTISQHLREMKSIGLVKGTVSGNKMCYCIDSNVFIQIKKIFENVFDCECLDC